jgi:GMP synthase-like glutamine amidotransferase
MKYLTEYGFAFDMVHFSKLAEYQKNPDITFITGSRRLILENPDFPEIDKIIKRSKLIIGICFGFQYLALKNGGVIKHSEKVHKEKTKISYQGDDYTIWFNHYDRIVSLPKKWKIISKFANFINIASYKNLIGFQFHPEQYKKTFDTFLLPILKSKN